VAGAGEGQQELDVGDGRWVEENDVLRFCPFQPSSVAA
jgi:hypothetical protein